MRGHSSSWASAWGVVEMARTSASAGRRSLTALLLVGMLVEGCRARERHDGGEPTGGGLDGRPSVRLARERAGGSSSASTGDSVERPARLLCELLHRWPAERRAACGASASVESLAEACGERLRRALQAGTVAIDRAALEACAGARAAQLEGCAWVESPLPAAPAPCHDVLRGKLTLGSPCASSLECSGRAFCDGAWAGRAGTCAEPRSTGAPCGATADSLGAFTLAHDLESSHPPCEGRCSLRSHRCVSGAAEPGPSEPQPLGSGRPR